MKNIILILTLCGLGLFSSNAFAQTSGDPRALSAGTTGLGFGILANDNPTGVVTGKFFFTDNLALNMDFALRIERGEFAQGPGSDWALLISPSIQYYFHTGHAVSPFLFGGLTILAFDTFGDSESRISIPLGAGAEYFIYDYFSIGGQMGIDINLVDKFGLGTASSLLFANFYF